MARKASGACGSERMRFTSGQIGSESVKLHAQVRQTRFDLPFGFGRRANAVTRREFEKAQNQFRDRTPTAAARGNVRARGGR